MPIIRYQGKVSDMFGMDARLNKDEYIEHEGYVPSGSGVGRGDYVDFEVDSETGQIQNWKNPLLESSELWEVVKVKRY